MNTNEILDSIPQKNSKKSPSFFPRVIREFEDGPHEEPMFYGGD